jgi:hypothetical protein
MARMDENPYQAPQEEPVATAAPPSGISVIKRSTWLGAKLSFAVLAPICILCWVGFVGLIVYKSVTLGVSPLEVIRAVDSTSTVSTLRGFLAPLLMVLVGTAFSAITGAAIGALATLGKRRRPLDTSGDRTR